MSEQLKYTDESVTKANNYLHSDKVGLSEVSIDDDGDMLVEGSYYFSMIQINHMHKAMKLLVPKSK